MIPVYGEYTQAELDRQYSQLKHIPEADRYFDQWLAMASELNGRWPNERVEKGGDEFAGLDVFRPDLEPVGVHIHVHGGGWDSLSSRDAWHVAPPWLEEGWVFVAVDYDLAPSVPLADQVRQIRTAVAWVRQQWEETKVVLSGHSAGAHLAASAVIDEADPGLRPHVTILASGIYDLEPVRQSYRNEYLALSESDALRLSPVRRVEASSGRKMVVLWSKNEMPEYQRQSHVFALRSGAVAQASEVQNHLETWSEIRPELLGLVGEG